MELGTRELPYKFENLGVNLAKASLEEASIAKGQRQVIGANVAISHMVIQAFVILYAMGNQGVYYTLCLSTRYINTECVYTSYITKEITLLKN